MGAATDNVVGLTKDIGRTTGGYLKKAWGLVGIGAFIVLVISGAAITALCCRTEQVSANS